MAGNNSGAEHDGDATPRRISMLGTLPPLLGISPYCAALASALAGRIAVEFISFRRHYPRWLYPGRVLEDPSARAPEHPRLEIHRKLNWYNPVGWLRQGLRIRGDVLHVQWWALPLAPVTYVLLRAARSRGIPTVMTVHNVESHERGAMFRWTAGRLFALVDRFIVHSAANARELERIYRISGIRVDVVPHGILHTADATEQALAKVRRHLALQPGSRPLLMFGAIRPYKGIDTALRAMPAIIARHPDAMLLIVGALRMDFGPCQDLIDQLGLRHHVRPVFGYVPEEDVASYFELCELVLLPYRHFSSQSGVGMLALSMKRPLIVSDVGALPEMAGDPCCVLPPGDPAALAETVNRVLADDSLLMDLRKAAEQRAAEHDWGSIADRTLAVYRACLQEARLG